MRQLGLRTEGSPELSLQGTTRSGCQARAPQECKASLAFPRFRRLSEPQAWQQQGTEPPSLEKMAL